MYIILIVLLLVCLTASGVGAYFLYFKKSDAKTPSGLNPTLSPTGPRSPTGTNLTPTLSPTQALSPTGTVSPILASTGANTPAQVPVGVVREFPPAPLTGLSTTLSGLAYGNGTYDCKISASYFGDGNAVQLFDKGNGVWHGAVDVYNDLSGVYISDKTTSDTNGVSHKGEWVQITLPSAIKLTRFIIASSTGNTGANVLGDPIRKSPRDFVILASNDKGVTWNTVHATSDFKSWNLDEERTFTVQGNSSAYDTYRLVVKRVGTFDAESNEGGQSIVFIKEWKLFGTT